MRKPHLPVLGLALFLVAVAPEAKAQSSQDAALAESLYQGSLVDIKAERYKDAKEKLEASLAIERGVGVLARLAWCEDHLGASASAWTHFSDALAMATKSHDDRAKQLEKDVRRTEALLSKVLLQVAPQSGGGSLELRRDGSAILAGAWTTPIPLDPGPHVIEATMPGKKPWKTTIVVEAKPGVMTVQVPALEDGPAGTGPAPVEPGAGSSGGSTQRTAGFAVLGIGAAGLAVGAILLGVDAAKHSSLADQCPAGRCSAALQGDVGTYHTLGIASSTSFIVGGALAATGVVLVLASPKAQARAAGVVPLVGLGFVGLGGRFQ